MLLPLPQGCQHVGSGINLSKKMQQAVSSMQGVGQPPRPVQLSALPPPAAPASSSSSCCCWAEALGPKPSLRLGCSPDAAILAGHQSPPNSAGCKAPFQAGAAARRNLGSSPSDRQAAELVNSNYSRNCATNRMLRHGRNTPPLSVTDSAIAPSARMPACRVGNPIA